MMEAGFADLGARSHSDHSSEGLDGFKVEAGGDGSPDSPMPDDRHDSQAQHMRLTHDDAVARLKQLVNEMGGLLKAHGLPCDRYLCGPTWPAFLYNSIPACRIDTPALLPPQYRVVCTAAVLPGGSCLVVFLSLHA